MYKNFRGNIDELLAHCASADANEVEQVVCDGKDMVLSPEEARDSIMEDYHLSKEDAEKFVTQIQLEEFDRIAKKLVEKGLLKITSYGDSSHLFGDGDGNPTYSVV